MPAAAAAAASISALACSLADLIKHQPSLPSSSSPSTTLNHPRKYSRSSAPPLCSSYHLISPLNEGRFKHRLPSPLLPLPTIQPSSSSSSSSPLSPAPVTTIEGSSNGGVLPGRATSSSQSPPSSSQEPSSSPHSTRTSTTLLGSHNHPTTPVFLVTFTSSSSPDTAAQLPNYTMDYKPTIGDRVTFPIMGGTILAATIVEVSHGEQHSRVMDRSSR